MTKNDIFNIIKKNILDTLPKISPNIISYKKKLIDLGANSVDRIEIIIMSMKDLNIKIPLLNFSKVSTIEDLINVLISYVL
ncbi:acyl carrier protein, PedN homolog [Candidatus Profftella armatura (Diaphorina cf. continua)]|uniref:Acyl carrier protein, PedN homolog n=1 Tax=Candidatus Profftella armatura (Diaphorina cf. continua) TaxID=2661583 RepID=A0A7R6VYP2_9PROT|nr:phosphopantetheine-binding protein [Candidatus Profftella armatura (Diaphorina cf. continua)]BCG49553.1 acyl carrier protein, PedN homolog [Candidatus Profftella armatura (Diaphorina cf. continua)]